MKPFVRAIRIQPSIEKCWHKDGFYVEFEYGKSEATFGDVFAWCGDNCAELFVRLSMSLWFCDEGDATLCLLRYR
jgi:hypothetical protein